LNHFKKSPKEAFKSICIQKHTHTLIKEETEAEKKEEFQF